MTTGPQAVSRNCVLMIRAAGLITVAVSECVSATNTQRMPAIQAQGVSAILFAQSMSAIHDAPHRVCASVWALSV
jgi:hypothetical protein